MADEIEKVIMSNENRGRGMKEGWKEARLGDICRVINGRAYLKPEMLNEGKYRLLRVGNFFTNDSWYYTNLELEEDKYCKEGDLLYAWSASFGPKIWHGEKVVYHYHIWKMVCNETIVNKYFMFHWLNSEALKKQTMTNLHGSTMAHITKNIIENSIVSYPSLSEQQSIVAHLDASFAEIDALKAKAAEEVANAKAMFDAALREEMTPKEGWEEKTLKELSLIAGNYGLSVPSCKYNGVRYLRITDITDWGELNNEFVSADIESTDNQIELQEGDILFARTGATVGKTLVYSRLMGLCVFAGYLIRYRIDCNKILPRYMFYETHSPWYFKWVKKNQQAAAQPNISAKLYNTYLVKYPSIEIQQRIVAKLDTLRSHLTELEQKYNLIAANCDALKQAILRETFE